MEEDKENDELHQRTAALSTQLVTWLLESNAPHFTTKISLAKEKFPTAHPNLLIACFDRLIEQGCGQVEGEGRVKSYKLLANIAREVYNIPTDKITRTITIEKPVQNKAATAHHENQRQIPKPAHKPSAPLTNKNVIKPRSAPVSALVPEPSSSVDNMPPSFTIIDMTPLTQVKPDLVSDTLLTQVCIVVSTLLAEHGGMVDIALVQASDQLQEGGCTPTDLNLALQMMSDQNKIMIDDNYIMEI